MLLNLIRRRRHLDIQELRVYICQKYEGEEDFTNKKLDKICSREKLSAEDVIYFLIFSLTFLQ